ncbi:MAG: hypothetical protein ACE5E4_04280 [Candidatus Binatia bacterium]
MHAALKFTKGLLRSPLRVKIWLLLLVAVNLLGPLAFLDRLEARVVLVVFLAGAGLMVGLTALSGFTRLLGLGHVLWVPLLCFLWARLNEIPANDAFGLWLRLLMSANAVSLILDLSDVVRYLRGERAEVVEGL